MSGGSASGGLRTLLKGSVLLLLGNSLAGVLNYAFQVQAAAGLVPAEYGKLNLWMAYLGLTLSLGAVLQIFACFSPASPGRMKQLFLFALPTSIVLPLISWLAWRHGGDATSRVFLVSAAGAALLGGLLFHSLLGQYQARTWFAGMGTATLLLAALKVSVSSISPHTQEVYYLAFPLAYGAACALLATLGWRLSRHTARSVNAAGSIDMPSAKRSSILQPQVLTASGLLAITLALAPQLDFLNLSASQPNEILGQFAQSALFAKGIYFVALTLLQVTLPLHIESAKHSPTAPAPGLIRRIELGGLALCAVGSFILAWIGPFIADRFLAINLDGKGLWILLSCLSLTALFRQVQQVQLECALGKLRQAALRLGVLLLWMLCWRLLPQTTVETYLACSLVFYVGLDLVGGIVFRERGMT